MDLLGQAAAIALVFGLLGTVRWLLRRNGGRIRQAPVLLESRGKLALTARHSVHLIRIGDRNLILALHPEGVTFLGESAPASSALAQTKGEDVARMGSAAR